MQTKILITTITGAIIGYITNWLAIKMLFRPREEKHFLGFKVPFTPGLIPKEKTRIAKSVGETVGNHLLTKETMVKSLCSDKINDKLRNWVLSKIEVLKNSNSTLREKLINVFGDKYNQLINSITGKISSSIMSSIRDEESKNKIVDYLCNTVKQKLKDSPQELTKSEVYNNVTKKLSEYIMECKKEGKLLDQVGNVLKKELQSIENSNSKIRDVLPQSAINNLKVYMFNKKNEICLSIKNMINEDKNQAKIKEIVSEAVGNNLSPMIAMFLNKDSIHIKTMGIINDFLQEEKNKQDVIIVLGDVLDKVLEKELSDILINSSEEGKDETLSFVAGSIVNKCVTDENILQVHDKIINTINDISSIEEALLSIDEEFYQHFENFIHRKVNEFVQSEFLCGKIQFIVNNIINSIVDKPINELICGSEDKISHYACGLSQNIYNRFIENGAEEVIETLDISTIVEDKINSFDVAFAEEIILQIASKELSAITWLGALLGGIMGLVSSLISIA